VTLDQLKAGVVETPVAPLEGAVREGAGSSCAPAADERTSLKRTRRQKLGKWRMENELE
jgi:hypothetical protein